MPLSRAEALRRIAYEDSEEKCFTFLWKLENASFLLQKTGKRLSSPAFVVDTIDQTKWRLWLYPRGDSDEDWIAFYLHREADSKGASIIKIKCELAFIGKDDSELKSYGVVECFFSKNSRYGKNKFVNRKDVVLTEKSRFLPQGTLTARCRIWKSVGKVAKDIRCIFQTCIGVEKRFFQWNVKNFSALQSEKKCTYQIKTLENDVLLMSIDLFLTGGISSEELICFELSLQDSTIKFSTLRLFLIDSLGNKVESNKEEIWYDDPAQCKQFTFSFTKEKLLQEKNTYLSEDTLSLLWEWAFSKGVVSEEIEEDKSGCICPEVKISDGRNANYDKTTVLNVLVDNVKSLYEEHFLSDVKLKTNTSVFPAHKFILSASSSVFKAMFSNDMKEKDSNFVYIEDLSDNTISRMLLYIYTARVENLTWESASELYVAADKYAILSLKTICSSYVKDNLSPSNACKVLLLSDFHCDDDLKSSVQNYILKHGKQVTSTDEWKALVESNAKLAVDTLCLLFK